MGVKSGFAAEWYRLGFDISFPLYAQAPVNETAVELSNRRGGFATRPSKYLLTFKGGNNRRYRPRPYQPSHHSPRRREICGSTPAPDPWSFLYSFSPPTQTPASTEGEGQAG